MNRLGYVSLALTSALLLPLLACSHGGPEATIAVVDTSLSITPRAKKAALDAIRAHIEQMQRGDLLVLIPVTGDAANDAGGRILRLAAPARRQSFDADLRRFNEQADQQLAPRAASLDPHQSKTDILGALDAAQQEIALLPIGSRRHLIIVSDFLEDDDTYRFISARELATPEIAGRLAAGLRSKHGFTAKGVHVCLGRLESSDYAALPARRKESVLAFWMAYLTDTDEPSLIRFDGPDVLANPDGGCTRASKDSKAPVSYTKSIVE